MQFIFVAGNTSDPHFSWDLVAMAHNLTGKLFPAFYGGLREQGWDVERTQFGHDEWRIDWEPIEKHEKSL